jgi:isopenicillin-N N-acyltransferase like protein
MVQSKYIDGLAAQTVIHPAPPPVVRVSGSHYEMGRQIGLACTEAVRHSLENARNLLEGANATLQLSWTGAQIHSRKYLLFAEEQYPQYVQELAGIAEGANVPFDDLVVLNSMEAVTMDAIHLAKCTTMALGDTRTANGHVLLAHNEDWLPEDEADVYLVHATPDDEPPFLAMTYGGLLPNIGLNAAGVAQCCDSVYPTDSRIGLPRVIVSRAVLAAEAPGEAINAALSPQRAAGYNHLLAHESGELYNVEVSARKFAILGSESDALVHTNHYLDYDMQGIEADSDELISTRIRYLRAKRLLQQTGRHTIHTLAAIQRDHVNYPNSICNHSITHKNPLDREKTINALIMDLTERSIHLAWGNPCQNKYETYYLGS